ncbi:hypothetical protein [Spiroplasma diminutum]|uniref:Transmembrane protein n=1 Tax=Spiroplasma diminutum CUAS-1 TaxID=1276221 RepID=S5MK59_9MOLU|nr:hypothetical protein [Spiroplasma diminutum]AGR42355.1 hypothetical protein SDIMI_v3c06510 [Spiroplasma diminutum CUAS-1]
MKKNKNYKKWFEYYFYVWCTLALFFALLLDIICGYLFDPKKTSFDLVIIDQTLYLSVWVALITSMFGLINWINYHKKNMANWMVGKNAHTAIATLNFLVFLLFNITFIVQKGDIIGFDTWYGRTKSSIEHIITPIMVLAFYFIYQKERIEDKIFAKNYCWFNLIYIGTYSFYILLRTSLIYNLESNEELGFLPFFPYPQIDPKIVGFPIFIIGTLSGNFGTVLISIFLNAMSNLNLLKLESRRNLKNIKKSN